MKLKYESPEADVIRLASLTTLALIEERSEEGYAPNKRGGSINSSTTVGEGVPDF